MMEMMTMKLIDRDALKEKIYKDFDRCNSIYEFTVCILLRIEAAPIIEADPVRHGRWIDNGDYAICTECSGRSATQYDGVEPIALMTRYCPHCGAKMDGGAEDDQKT